MDLRRLREETRPEHEATEANMPLFAPGLTVAQYLAVLEAMLPVVASWEAWAELRAAEDVLPLLPPRRRAHLLRQDVAVLRRQVAAETASGLDGDATGLAGLDGAGRDWAGMGWAGLDWDGIAGVTRAAGTGASSFLMEPTVEAAMESEGSAEGRKAAWRAGFLGAWYVMEGSTLGGRLIARHVEAVLGLDPGVGDAYFQGHGEATGSLWRETTALLAAVPEELAEAVIGAAKRTFVAFGAALGERRQARAAAG